MRQIMTIHALDFDHHCGPQPLIQPLEATPCRRALLANAGHVGPSPELMAHHRREAQRLRQATFRQAWRAIARFVRRAH
jgi:hypothetical protein